MVVFDQIIDLLNQFLACPANSAFYIKCLKYCEKSADDRNAAELLRSGDMRNSNVKVRSHEKEIGTTDWVEIMQDMINKFAEATGDHQWIHVDTERAKKESPFGTTIAHGFLTLSLLPKLMAEVLEVQGIKFGLNYGTDKVRRALH